MATLGATIWTRLGFTFRRGSWLLAVLIVICVGIELALQMSDRGLVTSGRLRTLAYDFGGFWPGLLDDWRPNYPAQPYAMFVTYGFLHGGFWHLTLNMVTLWSLGQPILDRVGTRGFGLLYGAAVVGGAVGFALLASGLRPMVGASGALFGLAGGLLAWAYVDRFTFREGLWPIGRAVLFLVLLNLGMLWELEGQLAWETHLGGFVTGWVAALLIDPRALPAEEGPDGLAETPTEDDPDSRSDGSSA